MPEKRNHDSINNPFRKELESDRAKSRRIDKDGKRSFIPAKLLYHQNRQDQLKNSMDTSTDPQRKRKESEIELGKNQGHGNGIIEGNENVIKKVKNMAEDELIKVFNRLAVVDEIKKEEAKIKEIQDINDYYRQRAENDEI